MTKQYVAITIIFILCNMGTEECVSSQENSSQVKTGQNLFNGEGMCFGCHGKDADGQTGLEPIATQIQPKPPDLRDSRSLRHQKSEDIFRFLKDRLHGPVSDEELWQLIAYLHTIRN